MSTMLLCKTYRSCIEDLCTPMVPIFDALVEDFGISGTVALFDEIAFDIINGAVSTTLSQKIQYVLHDCDIATKLQVLRFGKRFTPETVTADQEKEAIGKFLMRNNRAKLFDRKGLPYWLERDLSYIASTYMPKTYSEKNTFDPYTDMPSGTTAEGCKTHFEKTVLYYAQHHDIHGLPVHYVPEKQESVLRAVPKNFKGPRIICEEPLWRQVKQTPVMNYFYRALASKKGKYHPYGRVDLEHQSRNQELARIGSENRSLATIDLEAASDSITWSVIMAITPKQLVNDVIDCLSTTVELPDGRCKTLYIACTMGARATVPMQTNVYWVIICEGAGICIACGVGTWDMLDWCSAYNDDIVVPTIWYDTIVELLELCGFTVNRQKSFSGDHPYRESCGHEYYDGARVDGIYWPRKQLYNTTQDVPSLVKLANRLYTIGAMKAYDDVARAADLLVMTKSNTSLCIPRIPVGSEEVGIWSDYVTFHSPVPANGGVIVDIIIDSTYHHKEFKFLDEDAYLPDEVVRDYEYTIAERSRFRPFTATHVFDEQDLRNVKMLFEHYRYERFLRLGPSYLDDVCELCHASTRDIHEGGTVNDGYIVHRVEFVSYLPLIPPTSTEEEEEEKEKRRARR